MSTAKPCLEALTAADDHLMRQVCTQRFDAANTSMYFALLKEAAQECKPLEVKPAAKAPCTPDGLKRRWRHDHLELSSLIDRISVGRGWLF